MPSYQEHCAELQTTAAPDPYTRELSSGGDTAHGVNNNASQNRRTKGPKNSAQKRGNKQERKDGNRPIHSYS